MHTMRMLSTKLRCPASLKSFSGPYTIPAGSFGVSKFIAQEIYSVVEKACCISFCLEMIPGPCSFKVCIFYLNIKYAFNMIKLCYCALFFIKFLSGNCKVTLHTQSLFPLISNHRHFESNCGKRCVITQALPGIVTLVQFHRA